ncbi:MAG: HAMP domain-containing histidine kinase [Coriobacteriia bacterium]|nr:HAMP domain-containing histidine kinase [Coriobacteriia bacterium]
MSAEPTRPERPEEDAVFELVAHEIRAPLTVISGYLEILDRPVEEAVRARALAESRRAIGRIDALLEDLLSAASAGEYLSPGERAPVSMAELATDVVTVFSDTGDHPFTLETESPGDVLGDATRLRQVLVNLVGNATAYTPPSARITVGVHRVGDSVIVTVEDEGPGIPEEARDAAFERFERLGADNSAHPGSGLGLYIVRAIVEAHGGSVRAEAGGGGRGAKFVIELPASPGF